jgi:hypothetical protein
MPYNGAGIFTLTTGNPVVTGTVISSTWANNTLSDIANNGLTNCITKDGQTTPTANLPMGNFNFTNLAAPTGTGQALRWEQLQKGSDIASAATITIPNEGAAFDITGTTTITAFSGTFPGRIVYLRFKAALSLTNSASLVLPNGKDLKPYPNDVYAFESVDSGVWQWVGGTNRLPALYRSGGTLTASTTSVTIAPGAWRSAGDETNLVLLSSITKNIQSSGAWAAGSGNNGLFTGALAASTWYHVFVIRNTTTGAVDAGFDTSPTAANIPSGWVAYRRVGAVSTNVSSVILPFAQNGNEFRYITPTDILNNVGVGVAANVVVTVPQGIACRAKLGLYLDVQATALSVAVFAVGEADRTGARYAQVVASSAGGQAAEIYVMTDTSRQVVVKATNAAIPSGFYLQTRGYFDFVGD